VIRRIAFLGPSLPVGDALAIDPELLVLPPAEMGDLISAIRRHRPVAVALIDGTFLQNMAVFHKEILHALSLGTRIVGASSMGALRAAEMERFGMIGIGQVFDDFAGGRLADDDEVALTHADAANGYRPLSEAMVNIRATLGRAVDDGLLTPADAGRLTDLQKQRWFPQRSLAGLLEDARALGTVGPTELDRLAGFLRGGGLNVKAADARAALAFLTTLPDELVPEADRPEMIHSGVYQSLLDRDLAITDSGLTGDQIRFHAALNDPEFDECSRSSQRRFVLARMALTLGVEADESARQAARDWVLRAFGATEADLADHLTRLDMTEEDMDELVEREALVIRFERSFQAQARPIGVRELIDELRLRGRYEAARDGAALFESLAAASGSNSLTPTLHALMATQSAVTGWRVPDDIDQYIQDRALGDRGQLFDQLMVSVVALHELIGFPLVGPRDAPLEPELALAPLNTRGT